MSSTIFTDKEITDWKNKLFQWSLAIENDPVAKEKQGLRRELSQITARMNKVTEMSEIDQEKLLFDIERLSYFIDSLNLPLPEMKQLSDLLKIVETAKPVATASGDKEVIEHWHQLQN